MLGDGGGEGRQEEEEQEEGKEKDVDYTSSEEIHVAAMEGIKTSTLRKLVRELSTCVVRSAAHPHHIYLYR